MALWIHKRRFLDMDIFWNNRNFNQKSFQPVLFVGGFVSTVYWSNDGDDKQNNCVYILCCIHTILWGSVTNQVCRVAWKESHFWDICDPPKRHQVSTNCSPNSSGTLNSTHWTLIGILANPYNSTLFSHCSPRENWFNKVGPLLFKRWTRLSTG